jgi:hypothetical protein
MNFNIPLALMAKPAEKIIIHTEREREREGEHQV